jgi:ribosomal protein S6--L-glutamate ligase
VLFEKLKIPHPATKRWISVKKFRDTLKAESGSLHEMPFFLKADKSHEGEGIHWVTDSNSLEKALGSLEKGGSDKFVSQELISCGGNVLRAVVLHKRIVTYWKKPGTRDEVVTSVSRGSRVDKKWKPELQEKARAQALWICEKTGIDLAAFDFAFNLDQLDSQPYLLEINYSFGRKGLGGSLRYYRLLLKAIQEWLEDNGFDSRTVKLV